jgi:hypothetical protein
MKMAQDYVFHLGTVDIQQRQALRGTTQELASTSRADFFSKTKVNHHCLSAIGEGPDKVGHFHWGIVMIANEQFG